MIRAQVDASGGGRGGPGGYAHGGASRVKKQPSMFVAAERRVSLNRGDGPQLGLPGWIGGGISSERMQHHRDAHDAEGGGFGDDEEDNSDGNFLSFFHQVGWAWMQRVG